MHGLKKCSDSLKKDLHRKVWVFFVFLKEFILLACIENDIASITTECVGDIHECPEKAGGIIFDASQ